MENRERVIWRWLRALRWVLWIGFLAYSLEFVLNRASHMNSFGQLLFSTEVVMFGLPPRGSFCRFFRDDDSRKGWRYSDAASNVSLSIGRFAMRFKLLSLVSASLLCVPFIVWAKAPPPEGSKPLTKILRPIETGPDFAYFEEVEFENGKYKIEYYKKDGSKQKMEIDPMTGAPRESAPAR